MLRPTDTLRSEHAAIAAGLSVVGAIAAHVRGGGEFPSADVAELLRFLREFLQAAHLHKEAQFLYPGAAMNGDEHAATVVGDLMRLHDEVTDLLHALVLFWEPSGELTAAERLGFADAAATLVARVRRMQQIEEGELFPTCEAVVPADDQLEWNQRFADIDRERSTAAAWWPRLTALQQRWAS